MNPGIKYVVHRVVLEIAGIFRIAREAVAGPFPDGFDPEIIV